MHSLRKEGGGGGGPEILLYRIKTKYLIIEVNKRVEGINHCVHLKMLIQCVPINMGIQ